MALIVTTKTGMLKFYHSVHPNKASFAVGTCQRQSSSKEIITVYCNPIWLVSLQKGKNVEIDRHAQMKNNVIAGRKNNM